MSERKSELHQHGTSTKSGSCVPEWVLPNQAER